MRIISGIQPTGELHIGNYLGAVKQWVRLQENNECFFFIADLHALTREYQPRSFQENIFEKAVDLLSLGLDPEKCVIFIQSQIKEHTELAWLLNVITKVAELERMTQYKEKAKKFRQNINAGLLTYPVLQAADILIYQTDAVPVGRDQIQHIELARTIARKFNNIFGQTFKEPKAMMLKEGAKIMSLQDPKKKMSKSDSPQGCIGVFDPPELIKKRVMSAVTDTGKGIKYYPAKKPGISNLVTIFSLFSEKPIKEVERKFKGKGYSDFKKELTDLLVKKLELFRQKKKSLIRREAYVREILEQGRRRAQSIADSTMKEVRANMGLM
ncbi:MAG: tryptophan--tRNA ligase [Candidatus Nealsonbacteria bacterium]|nr:tryptophan--tRNA ligase [Candidatus Nealsonbacteria bacterium]